MKNDKNAIIKFQNLDFSYGKVEPILHNINLEIERGGFYFLTGKSGAGKTSLLKLIYLGIRPTNGYAYIFGKESKKYTNKQIALMRQNISVVFQDYKLLPHLSAYDNVALPLRIKGEDNKTIDNKVRAIIKWVGLEKHLNNLPETLSGGQQQRLSIARSVITQPKIILADEPTGSVDDVSASRIFSLFEQLHQRGTTIIMATHNQNIVNSKPYPELHIHNNSIFLNHKNNGINSE